MVSFQLAIVSKPINALSSINLACIVGILLISLLQCVEYNDVTVVVVSDYKHVI